MLPTPGRPAKPLSASSWRPRDMDFKAGHPSCEGFMPRVFFFSFHPGQVRAARFFSPSYKTKQISFLGLRWGWGRWVRNTECGPSTSPSLYCIVTVNLTINTTVGSEAPEASDFGAPSPGATPTPGASPPGSVHYLQLLFPLSRPPPARQRVCKKVASSVCASPSS